MIELVDFAMMALVALLPWCVYLALQLMKPRR